MKNKIRNKKVVLGVFRLLSKKETDNCRNSATCELLNEIHANTNYNIIIYEPTLDNYEDYEIVKQLDVFIKKADIIIANRYDECLASVNSKVFTRDGHIQYRRPVVLHYALNIRNAWNAKAKSPLK